MPANKKRRRLPEEDLAAAVADIINSPITRTNLNFLRPLAPLPVASEPQEPMPSPMGSSSIPMGPALQPEGVELIPEGFRSIPLGDSLKPEGVEEIQYTAPLPQNRS